MSKKLCEAYREGHDFTPKLIETLKYGIHQLFLSERETFYIKKLAQSQNKTDFIPKLEV